jgi:hypothetical protein
MSSPSCGREYGVHAECYDDGKDKMKGGGGR